MSNYEFYQPMGGPNGRYPQMGAGGRAPVRASSVTDIHSLYSGLPGMLIIFSILKSNFRIVRIVIPNFWNFCPKFSNFWRKFYEKLWALKAKFGGGNPIQRRPSNVGQGQPMLPQPPAQGNMNYQQWNPYMQYQGIFWPHLTPNESRTNFILEGVKLALSR